MMALRITALVGVIIIGLIVVIFMFRNLEKSIRNYEDDKTIRSQTRWAVFCVIYLLVPLYLVACGLL